MPPFIKGGYMEENLKFKLKEKTEGWIVLANKEKPTFSIDSNEEEYSYLAAGPFLSQEEVKNYKERLEVFFITIFL